MIVSKPEALHLPAIAACHRKAFPRALSSAMGQSYVEKMLEWYLVEPRAFLFFFEDNGSCVGYCGGLLVDGKTAVGSASSMIQYSFNAAVRAIVSRPWLLMHVEFRKKYRLAFKNVWRKGRAWLGAPAKPSTPSVNVRPHTGLIVIGVDPGRQGEGIGSQLLIEFERQSFLRGYRHMMLTVKSDNKTAISAYSRNGWTVTIEAHGSTMMEKIIG